MTAFSTHPRDNIEDSRLTRARREANSEGIELLLNDQFGARAEWVRTLIRRGDNTDLFRFRSRELDLAVKVGVTSRSLEDEYRRLQHLSREASCSGWRIRFARPVAWFPSLNGYAMEFVRGTRLDHAVAAAPRDTFPLVRALSACGIGLADLHRRGSPALAQFDWSSTTFRWMEAAGLRLARQQHRLLYEATSALDRSAVPSVRGHGDFDAVNVILTGEQVVALDPLGRVDLAPVHWDLAVMVAGLRRSWWRRPWMARRSARLAGALSEPFVNAYHSEGHRRRSEDAVAMRVAELLRLAQVASWSRTPALYSRRVRSHIRSTYTRPIVRIEVGRSLAALEKAMGI